jgi:hypothetical protein
MNEEKGLFPHKSKSEVSTDIVVSSRLFPLQVKGIYEKSKYTLKGTK